MSGLLVICSFLEVDRFGFLTLQDKLQEAELGKAWRMKRNADFEIASEYKLICFGSLSSFLLSSLRSNYFGSKLVCAIKKKKILFLDFCAVINVIQFSEKTGFQP